MPDEPDRILLFALALWLAVAGLSIVVSWSR